MLKRNATSWSFAAFSNLFLNPAKELSCGPSSKGYSFAACKRTSGRCCSLELILFPSAVNFVSFCEDCNARSDDEGVDDWHALSGKSATKLSTINFSLIFDSMFLLKDIQ